MNIRYGDDNYLVRYLQAFLQEYYNKSLRVSGIYDKYTHSNLIKYLNLPNVQNIDVVYSSLLREYPDLFSYFIDHAGSTTIEFTSKSTSKETIDYMSSIKETIADFVYDLGWKVTEFTNYKNNDNEKFRIVVASSGRENRFPNGDMLCMINLFMNQYLYDYTISSSGSTGLINPNLDPDINYKLAIVADCEPDTYYTICHAYESIINLTVGSSPYNSNSDFTVNNNLSNVESFYLDSGSLYCYKTSSDCKTIIIQLQYGGMDSKSYVVNVPIKIGDINLDGSVDNEDVEVLSQYISSQNTENPVELSLQQLYAAYIDPTNNPIPPDKTIADRKPNNYDLIKLNNFVTGRISSLGTINFPNVVEANATTENIIMVSKGLFKDDSDSGFKAETYFPSPSYAKNPWMINDKLLNYILDMAITPYSDEEDIIYLQDLLSQLDPSVTFEHAGIFTEDMQDMIRAYQISNGIPFHTGYLDVQTEAMMIKEINNIGNANSIEYENVYLSSGDGYIIVEEGATSDDNCYLAVERISLT